MPLYHVYNLTDNTKPVFIVEGEKDVETMEKLGYILHQQAQTAQILSGNQSIHHFFKTLMWLSLLDEVGLKSATNTAESIVTVVRSIKLVPSQALYAPLKPEGDISDTVECIGTVNTTQFIESVLNGNEYIFTFKSSSESQQDN